MYFNRSMLRTLVGLALMSAVTGAPQVAAAAAFHAGDFNGDGFGDVLSHDDDGRNWIHYGGPAGSGPGDRRVHFKRPSTTCPK